MTSLAMVIFGKRRRITVYFVSFCIISKFGISPDMSCIGMMTVLNNIVFNTGNRLGEEHYSSCALITHKKW